MVVNMGISKDQERAAYELRKMVSNVVPKEWRDDRSIYYRFLKARNWDMDLAEAMILKCFEWRKSYQMDTIATDFKPPEACLKYFSQSILGYSKTNHLVRYASLGNVDCRNLFKSTNKHTILKSILQMLEYDTRLHMTKPKFDKFGNHVTKGMIVINLENLSLATVTHKKTIETFIVGAKALQDNFPEAVHSIIVINASAIFTIGFEAIRPFLSEAVLSKVQVFGEDGYQEALLKIIDADVLPEFLGGRRTDPDGNPYCKASLNHGGPVPKKYYTSKVPLWQQQGIRKVVVDRLSKSVIEIEVPYADSVIEWKFQVKHYDIGFGLSFNGDHLIPNFKIETEVEAESSLYRCEQPGVYVVTFDNTYSWMHSKEVYYKIQVMPAEHYDKLQQKIDVPWLKM